MGKICSKRSKYEQSSCSNDINIKDSGGHVDQKSNLEAEPCPYVPLSAGHESKGSDEQLFISLKQNQNYHRQQDMCKRTNTNIHSNRMSLSQQIAVRKLTQAEYQRNITKPCNIPKSSLRDCIDEGTPSLTNSINSQEAPGWGFYVDPTNCSEGKPRSISWISSFPSSMDSNNLAPNDRSSGSLAFQMDEEVHEIQERPSNIDLISWSKLKPEMRNMIRETAQKASEKTRSEAFEKGREQGLREASVGTESF